MRILALMAKQTRILLADSLLTVKDLVSEVCPPVSGCGCAKSRPLAGEGCGWEAFESRLPA